MCFAAGCRGQSKKSVGGKTGFEFERLAKLKQRIYRGYIVAALSKCVLIFLDFQLVLVTHHPANGSGLIHKLSLGEHFSPSPKIWCVIGKFLAIAVAKMFINRNENISFCFLTVQEDLFWLPTWRRISK